MIAGIVVLLFTEDSLCADVADGRVLLREGFDGKSQSGLAKRLLSHRHISLAKGGGPDASNAIRVAYVGSKRGSERIVLTYPLGEKLDRATLSFDVKFDREFQWVRGGKLHGLGPKSPVTGGKERRPDAWSARMMFKRDGRCAPYLYDQDKAEKWGVGKDSPRAVFTAGKWHRVVFQVGLNEPGVANGVARILIDSREVTKAEKIMFRGRNGDQTLIQQLLFSTFHGGQSQKYAPVDGQGRPTTVYAYFDNFAVREGQVDAARGRR